MWLKAGKGPGKREKSPGEAMAAGKADVDKSKMNITETLGLGPKKTAPLVNLVNSEEEDDEEELEGGGAPNVCLSTSATSSSSTSAMTSTCSGT